MRCDAITGAVRVKGWSHSLAYCDKHLTSPKTLYTIKLPAKENWENDHQWNFFFYIDSTRKEIFILKFKAVFQNLLQTFLILILVYYLRGVFVTLFVVADGP